MSRVPGGGLVGLFAAEPLPIPPKKLDPELMKYHTDLSNYLRRLGAKLTGDNIVNSIVTGASTTMLAQIGTVLSGAHVRRWSYKFVTGANYGYVVIDNSIDWRKVGGFSLGRVGSNAALTADLEQSATSIYESFNTGSVFHSFGSGSNGNFTLYCDPSTGELKLKIFDGGRTTYGTFEVWFGTTQASVLANYTVVP